MVLYRYLKSKVEPWIVIAALDLAKGTRQLVYTVVFPVPCFVVYVTRVVYFYIYAGGIGTVKRRVVRRSRRRRRRHGSRSFSRQNRFPNEAVDRRQHQLLDRRRDVRR